MGIVSRILACWSVEPIWESRARAKTFPILSVFMWKLEKEHANSMGEGEGKSFPVFWCVKKRKENTLGGERASESMQGRASENCQKQKLTTLCRDHYLPSHPSRGQLENQLVCLHSAADAAVTARGNFFARDKHMYESRWWLYNFRLLILNEIV
jgi:hypothetical protein